MRIVVDVLGAQTSGSRRRGIGRYTRPFLHALIRNRRNHDIVVAANAAFADAIDELRGEFGESIGRENFALYHPLAASRSLGGDRDARRLSELTREASLRSLSPDFVIVTSLFEGLEDDGISSVGSVCHAPTAVVLYDLIPALFPKPYLEGPPTRRWYEEKLNHLKAADLLLAISESTRADAISLLQLPPGQVVNISADADEFVTGDRTNWSATRSRLGLTREVVLYTGGIDYRKNIDRLIAAYATIEVGLRRKYQLAIVCTVEEQVALRYGREAKRLGLAGDEVVFTGFVAQSELADLYANCALFVFPSWYEGFGLPVLEAMRAGAVVVGANASSLPEIIGMPDALFDPHSTPDMTRALTQGLVDEQFRRTFRTHARQHVRQFSWDRTADIALDAIESRWSGYRSTVSGQPAQRPKLAFVSPMPPQRSGVAHYGAELLPYLANYYDIEVVVADEVLATSIAPGDFVLRPSSWFRQNADRFDRVLYQLGNSSHHAHMPGLLRDLPGVVVLHDFYLSELFFFMERGLGWKAAFTEALFSSHGYAPLVALAAGEGDRELRARFPANYDVISQSLGVIAHSRYAANLAVQFYGEDAAQVVRNAPLMQMPIPLPDRAEARRALGLDRETFVICSFGFLANTKLDDRLLRAWAAARRRIDVRTELVFVGDAGNELMARLRAEAAALQVKVTVTGWVDPETYARYLAAADVAIQLRTESRGETSRAVLECMAAGVPVIVNANGSLAELPDQAGLKLDDDFDDQDLADAIFQLWTDPGRRADLGRAGLAHVGHAHAPQRTAEEYRDAIEAFYAGPANAVPTATVKALDILRSANADRSVEFAASLALIRPPLHQKQRLLLIEQDASPAAIRGLLEAGAEKPGLRIEPAHVDPNGTLRYARKLVAGALGVSLGLEDAPVDCYAGDELIVGDKAADLGAILIDLRRRGVVVPTTDTSHGADRTPRNTTDRQAMQRRGTTISTLPLGESDLRTHNDING